MERSSYGPLGKDLHADGSRLRDSKGCSLACSNKRVAVDDVELEVDALVQEFGVFRKLPNIFEAWLVWACGHRANWACIPLLGQSGCWAGFGWAGCLRVVLGWARCF
jgi:hypothetical protein